MIELECDYCGKKIRKSPCKVKRHNFCLRQCLGAFSSREKNPEGYTQLKDLTGVSQHMTELNKKLNPTRMSADVRDKLSDARYGTGEKTLYRKRHGRHEHRTVAEDMLGRKLRPREVVHHIDGNKRNNSPDNLMVFSSQSEHAKFHEALRREVIG